MIKGKLKPLNWKGGLEHKRELSEIILPLVDKIVTRHKNSFQMSAEQVLLKRVPQHPLYLNYGAQSLRESIERVYLHLNRFDSEHTN